jgi:hypothetical protein
MSCAIVLHALVRRSYSKTRVIEHLNMFSARRAITGFPTGSGLFGLRLDQVGSTAMLLLCTLRVPAVVGLLDIIRCFVNRVLGYGVDRNPLDWFIIRGPYFQAWIVTLPALFLFWEHSILIPLYILSGKPVLPSLVVVSHGPILSFLCVTGTDFPNIWGLRFSLRRLWRATVSFFRSGAMYSVAWIPERTLPTERPLLVGEVSINFGG